MPIAKLFRNSAQYVVPVFQRHYVWDKENQWEALWEDILSQTLAKIDGVPKPHYCGAIVLDLKQQGVDELTRFDVIDGQQRLTTFQIVLAALRDIAITHDSSSALKTLIPLLVNQNATDLPNPELDQFKLRPTRFDQQQFRDVITFGDREKLRQKYVLPRRGKPSHHTDARIASAYLYFYDKINEAVENREEVFGSDAYSAEATIEAITTSFTQYFQAVQITLDATDDAQVIFESLNSRGTPLLASDLMRNRIFLRAEQDGDRVEWLYDKYWSQFEDKFWTDEEKQGRLKKPRLEFFMVNVLSARNASEVHLSRIYQEYLSWLSGVRYTFSVEAELNDLSTMATVYKEMIQETSYTSPGRFGRFLNIFDISTLHPFVMAIWKEHSDNDTALAEIFRDLESYLVRRLICQRGTKNYNRMFLSGIKELRPNGFAPDAVRSFLLEQTAISQDWPTDAEFRSHWLTQAAYGAIAPARLNYILSRIEQAQRSKFSEEVTINSALTVEHILPQSWFEFWPLPDGSTVTSEFADDARRSHTLGLHLDGRGMAAARRQNLVNTFGNLTLLMRPLNSSVKNAAFDTKRAAILDHSALRLNRVLNAKASWDEEAILERGELLLADALGVWARPSR